MSPTEAQRIHDKLDVISAECSATTRILRDFPYAQEAACAARHASSKDEAEEASKGVQRLERWQASMVGMDGQTGTVGRLKRDTASIMKMILAAAVGGGGTAGLMELLL